MTDGDDGFAGFGRSALVAVMLCLGLFLWTGPWAAALVIGPEFLVVNSAITRLAIVAAFCVIAFLAARRFFRRNRIMTAEAKLAATMALVIPGLVLDATVFLFVDVLLIPERFLPFGEVYAGWSAAAYAAILIAGLANGLGKRS